MPLSSPVLASDLSRSFAATRVATHARAMGLELAHFEHDVHLELPEAWATTGRPDLGAVEGWRGGVLPETKFRHFRQDRRTGVLHPGHHARWTAHELLHRVAGFAWAPDKPLLWHATAARLAETLPVALWYFVEEATVARCPIHDGALAAWSLDCPRCEEFAAAAVRVPPREDVLAQARAFVRREIEGARATLREGVPVHTRFATIDLCSDGLAYVGAHGKRLTSAAMARLVPRFLEGGVGWHTDLEGLIARIEAMLEDLCGGAEAALLAGNLARGRAYDLASRIAQVAEDCDEETAEALWAIVDGLADDDDLARAARAYQDVFEEVELPSPEDVFAMGVALPAEAGLSGRSVRQVREGLQSVVPRALATLGDASTEVVTDFVAQDDFARVPLGHRFARFLAEAHSAAAELALVEATVAHLPAPDPGALTLAQELSVYLSQATLAPWSARLSARREVLEACGLLRTRRVLRVTSSGVAQRRSDTNAEVLVVRDLEAVGVLELPAGTPPDTVPDSLRARAWSAGAMHLPLLKQASLDR